MQLEGFNTRLFDDERWFIEQDASLTLEEKLIPILSSSAFFHQTAPIKKGKHKSLWRYVPSAGQENEAYLIKRYKTKHLLDHLKPLPPHPEHFRN